MKYLRGYRNISSLFFCYSEANASEYQVNIEDLFSLSFYFLVLSLIETHPCRASVNEEPGQSPIRNSLDGYIILENVPSSCHYAELLHHGIKFTITIYLPVTRYRVALEGIW